MKRVLVVDDNESNLYLMRQVLRSGGFVVDEARHGVDALALARRTQPSLLVTDLLMPEMDGYTLLRHWNADPALKHIPCIVYTATYTDTDDERLAHRLGADAFIVKPMESDALIGVVDRVIEMAKEGRSTTPEDNDPPPNEALVSYNATLVRKLEKRTQQMQAMARDLQASESRFKALADNSLDMILEVDPVRRRIHWANQAACEGFGRSLEALREAEVHELCDMSDGRAAALTAQRAATGRARGEVTLFRSNGERFPAELSSVVYLNPEGQQVASTTLRDLSAEKLAQSALLQSQADAATLLAAVDAHALLSMSDAEGFITFVNQRLCEVSGYAREELIGNTHLKLRSGRHNASEYHALWDTVRTGAMWKGEWCNRTKGGELFWVDTTVVPFAASEGQPDKYVIIQTDITARKQGEQQRDTLEAQLRETQKLQAVGTLASGIAHDFNNIVAAILGFSTLMREEIPPTGPAAEYLGQIQKAGKRARDVVQRIVGFSRPQPTRLTTVVVQDAVGETLAIAHGTLPATIALQTRLPPLPVLVRADHTQLQQVLLNLYTNAWHAAPAEGARIETGLDTLRFEAGDPAKPAALAPGPCAHLWVSDNGSGMSEEVRSRIFDPFFTTKAVGQGTGLGLSAVRGIVAAHQGAITVESQPGAGSTFHLYFPLVVEAAESKTAVAKPTDHGPEPVGAARVLYVDDDEAITLLAKTLLGQAGFQVTAFMHPEQALAAVRERPADFDLLVTDFNMPGLSGLELARQVQRVRADLPIAIVSGHISGDLVQRARVLNINTILHKERVTEDLVEQLHQLLKARQS